MVKVTLTPESFYPEVCIDASGYLLARTQDSLPKTLAFAHGLELAAIAIDDMGRPVFSRLPVTWQSRLFRHIKHVLEDKGARPSQKTFDWLRLKSAAATVLLNMAEGLRESRKTSDLQQEIFDSYFRLLEQTESHLVRQFMVTNLDRAKRILDREYKADLDTWLKKLYPQKPPYDSWFQGGSNVVNIVCQVQDVFYKPWQKFIRNQGFRQVRHASKRVTLERRVIVRDIETIFRIEYLKKAEDIFTPMANPKVDIVVFIGHSDWWARVPRNLKEAPDQKGAKLLLLILCFGKDFYHSLRERYPKAHIVTSKDPTDDPEDHVLVKHLFRGIAERKTWRKIQQDTDRDPKNPDKNFIFPNDARYIASCLDEDHDGRVDLYDRFCNVGGIIVPALQNIEENFVPDPLEVHPRGIEFHPQEVDGSKVFEAVLILNSLAYDNFFLDQANPNQTVVSAGWHLPRFGELEAIRVVKARRDRHRILRLTVNIRYARAAQSAITAMVVYEGYQYFSKLKKLQNQLDTALMGITLVAHALDNANYPEPEKMFYVFLRRYGFPKIDFKQVLDVVEADPNWESGSPTSLKRLKRILPKNTRSRLEELAHA
jgi:hypothetical protein